MVFTKKSILPCLVCIAALAVLAAPSAQAELLGYWTFDDGTGTDATGNSRDANLEGGATISGDDVAAALAGGQALDCTGGDKYAWVSNSSDFDAAVNELTVSCWIKGWPDGWWSPFVSKLGESGKGWQLRQGWGGPRVAFTIRGIDDENGGGSTGAAATPGWHHVVGTWDGTTCAIYIDGKLDKQWSRGGAPLNPATDYNVAFAARDRGGHYDGFFDLKLDEIAIWDQAITEVEAAFLSNGGAPTDIATADMVAVSGGPYTVDNAGNVTIDGSGSFGDDIVSYQWTVDGENLPEPQGSMKTIGTLTSEDLRGMGLEYGTTPASLIVTDSEGNTNTSYTTITMDFEANAGGPYTVGGVGDQTTDIRGDQSKPQASIVSWEWDLDGDGTFDDSTVMNPGTFSRTDFLDMGLPYGTSTVELKVTNSDGDTSTATADLTVKHVMIVVENFNDGDISDWYIGGGYNGVRLRTSDGADQWALILNTKLYGPTLTDPNDCPGDQHDRPTTWCWGPAFTIVDDSNPIEMRLAGGEHPWSEDLWEGAAGAALWDHASNSLITSSFITRSGTGGLNGPYAMDISGLAGRTVSIVMIDQNHGGWGWTGVDDITAVQNALEMCPAITPTVHMAYNFDTPGDFEGWWQVSEGEGNPITMFETGCSPGNIRDYINDNMVDREQISGAGYVSSTTSEGGWDGPTGILRSPDFTVDGDLIEFFLAGGNKNGLSFELRSAADDSVLRTARHVRDSGDMIRYQWTIRDLAGTQAYLALVDENNGGWGHIHLDQVSMFSVSPDLLAIPGGPYAIGFGDTINLDASASRQRGEAAIVSYEWDIDGDGAYDDATGATPAITYAQLDALGWTPADEPHNIGLLVTDSDGITNAAVTTIDLIEVAAEANGPYKAWYGTDVTLDGSGSTPASVTGSVDTYEWDINNDGTYDLNTSDTAISVSYDDIVNVHGLAPDFINPYTVTLRVTDNNSQQATDTAELTVVPELIAYWDCEDGSGTIATDQSGNGNDATFQGMNEDDWVARDSQTALDFDGNDDQLTTGKSAGELGIQGNFTAVAFVNIRSTGGQKTVFGTNQFASNVGLHLMIRDATPYMGFHGNDTGGGSLGADTWYHVAWRFKDGEQAIYVDGSQVAAGGDHANFAGNDEIRIGRCDGGRYMNGMLDEMAIFSRALTPDEIMALSMGATPQQVADGIRLNPGGPYSVAPGGSVDLDASASAAPEGSTITAYEWDLDGDSTPEVTGETVNLTYDDIVNVHGVAPAYTWQDITLTLTMDGSDTYTLPTTMYITPANDLSAGLVGYWPFDDGTADDQSGNDNHGSLEAGASTTNADTPAPLATGQSLDLTGGNKYVEVSNEQNFDLPTGISVSCWFKGQPSDWSPFVSKNGEQNAWQVRRHGGNLTVDWTTRGHQPANGDFEGIAQVIPADGFVWSEINWHHVVVTYDGREKVIYVDGALDNSQIPTGASIREGDDPVVFGARIQDLGSPVNFFEGMLDDIAIWNRSLTTEEVEQLFAGESPMDVLRASAGGPYAAGPDDSINLDASLSSAPSGETITEYSWDIDNDGTFGDETGETVALTYAELESYGLVHGENTISLQATDSAGSTATDETTVSLLGRITLTPTSSDILLGNPDTLTVSLDPNPPADGVQVVLDYDSAELTVFPESLAFSQSDISLTTSVEALVEGDLTVTATANGYADEQITYTASTAPTVPGDVDGDGCVNVADLLTVRNNLGNEGSEIFPPEADVTADDDIVNVADLLFVRNRLGDGSCPQ